MIMVKCFQSKVHVSMNKLFKDSLKETIRIEVAVDRECKSIVSQSSLILDL